MYRNGSYRTWQFLCIGVVLFIILSGCQGVDDTAKKYIATVNGAKIFLSDFNERLKKELDIMESIPSLKEGEIDRLKEEILNELIDDKIMLLRAEKLSLSVSNEDLKNRIEEINKDYPDGGFKKIFTKSGIDYDIWKEALKKRVMLEKLVHHDVNSIIMVEEDEAFAYYEDHSEQYISGERVHAAHIVVQSRKEAEEVLKRLKGGEDFGKVAQEISTGPESIRGGDLGVFSREVMPESFDKVVFSLPPGKISKVVNTPYGYHIFKVFKKSKGERISFSEVKKKIIFDLKKEKEELEYMKWLKKLRSEVDIKINRDLLRKVKVS
ncbi:MAG: peptidylprolyl isomerase [Syntrophales bacterium]|nr:peptidylprolyl isomerase [Syntrophales bacterium]